MLCIVAVAGLCFFVPQAVGSLTLATFITRYFWVVSKNYHLHQAVGQTKGPFTLGVIPAGYRASNQRTFIYFCVTPERYASGTALDRFQSDIPAGSRSPVVHLTNQRFCFAVVMPLPVTGLAGSDAYLGHHKTRCRRV